MYNHDKLKLALKKQLLTQISQRQGFSASVAELVNLSCAEWCGFITLTGSTVEFTEICSRPDRKSETDHANKTRS